MPSFLEQIQEKYPGFVQLTRGGTPGTDQQNAPWNYSVYTDYTTEAGLQAAMDEAYAGMAGNSNLNSNWSKEQYAGWQGRYNQMLAKLNELRRTTGKAEKETAQTEATKQRGELETWATGQVAGMPKYGYTPDWTKFQFTPEMAQQWLAYTNEMYKPLEAQGQQALAEEWNTRGRLMGGGAYQAQRQLLAEMMGKKMETAIGLGERQTGRNIQAETGKESLARYKYGTNELNPWQIGYQTQFGLKEADINDLLRKAGLPIEPARPISMPQGYTQEPGAFEKFITAVLPTIIANIAAPGISSGLGLTSRTPKNPYTEYMNNYKGGMTQDPLYIG